MDSAGPGRMALEDFVLLETQVWRALQTGDGDLDRSLLSEDFLGVYPSGFSDRTGHVGELANGPTVDTFHLSQARMFEVTNTDVMLSYRAEYERPVVGGGAKSTTEVVYISSLWSRREGRWINSFSQDTPANSVAASSTTA